MKTESRIQSAYFMKSAALLALFCAFGLSGLPLRAETDSARVVKYSQKDIVPVRAKVRFSTLIVLPDSEEILDFTTGDKDFWIINGSHNLCFIHPAQAGIRSNLNLITASGHVYSFLLTEISNEPNARARSEDLHRAKRRIERRRTGLLPGLCPRGRGRSIQEGIQTLREQADATVQTAETQARPNRSEIPRRVSRRNSISTTT